MHYWYIFMMEMINNKAIWNGGKHIFEDVVTITKKVLSSDHNLIC